MTVRIDLHLDISPPLSVAEARRREKKNRAHVHPHTGKSDDEARDEGRRDIPLSLPPSSLTSSGKTASLFGAVTGPDQVEQRRHIDALGFRVTRERIRSGAVAISGPDSERRREARQDSPKHMHSPQLAVDPHLALRRVWLTSGFHVAEEEQAQRLADGASIPMSTYGGTE